MAEGIGSATEDSLTETIQDALDAIWEDQGAPVEWDLLGERIAGVLNEKFTDDGVRFCASCGTVELPSECSNCIDAVTER